MAKRGPVGVWQRYEEATMCQRRPADPTDPGDAADLSIMGYLRIDAAVYPRARIAFVLALYICATTLENQ